MEDAEFADYFKVLDKASDRLRKVIYVFIVVYVAMLLYGISAFLYPAGQYAYDDLHLKARCAYAHYPGKVCQDLKHDLDAHKITPEMSDDINFNLWEHQLANLYDNSVKTRTFSFPIFGLEIDRDLLWVLFPLVGTNGYYIVLLTLGSTLRLFSFLMQKYRRDGFRLRMIQSTLVITVPLETTKAQPRFGHIDPLLKSLWRVLAVGVLLMPIFLSALMIIDQTNVIAAWWRSTPGEKVLKNHGFLFEVELAFEALLIVFELMLFWALIQVGKLFGEQQKEIAFLIEKAETAKGDMSDEMALAAE